MTTSDGLAEADVHEGNEFLVRRSWFLVWAFDLLPPIFYQKNWRGFSW
jgi:hypothetical protein